MNKENFLALFPGSLQGLFGQAANNSQQIQEIRMRVGLPILIQKDTFEFMLDENGNMIQDRQRARCVRRDEIDKMMLHLCHDSVYAFEDEIRNGFLTMPGGHRVGVTGQVVLGDNGQIRTIKYISCLNIRIAHELLGIASSLLPYMYQEGRLQNTLIVSPPGCGKTTLLRDLIRQISNGNRYGNPMQVSVVDERCEIAGSFQGIAQNHMGDRTDVLSACPKSIGMMLLLRSMAPQVMAIDELGGTEDIKALQHVLQSGCCVLVTIHGENMEELRQKKNLAEIFENHVFQRYVFLECREHQYKIKMILNGELQDV